MLVQVEEVPCNYKGMINLLIMIQRIYLAIFS